MISPALKILLDTIRSKEAPKGYGQIYSGAKGVPLSTDVSRLTLSAVLGFQSAMLKAGSKSSACGGYQFLQKTLKAAIDAMGLTGNEVWTPELQDLMAVHLMYGRGFSQFMTGRLTPEGFANNLAKEWASLPVVSIIKGAHRIVQPGETYYAGDGLNKSHHAPETILALVRALRAAEPAQPAMPVPASPPPVLTIVVGSGSPATEPAKGFWAWVRSLFS